MVPDGWQSAHVSDICSLQNGRGFKPEEWDTKGLPIIRIQNLNGNPQFNYFSGQVEDKWLVQPGQMLFAWAGTKGVSFGPTIWRGELAVLNQHIFKVFHRKGIHRDWLYVALQHVTHRIEAKAHGFKATLVHVKKSEIDRQPILVPPLSEQRHIADVISTWDSAIRTLEKLIDNSEAQKRALMQQLLMGKDRFVKFVEGSGYTKAKYGRLPKDWDFVAIGKHATECVERNSTRAKLPVVSCSKHAGFVDSLTYFKKKVYSDNTSGYKVIPRGAFGFPSNHIEEGSIGRQNLHDRALVSPIYCVFQVNPSVHEGYLHKLLKTDHYRQIFSATTNSSVDRRGSLRWKEFAKIKIPLPNISEQKKISAVIDVAELETANLRAQLACLEQQRQALMLQLLTGKRRLRVDERAA